MCRTMTLGGSLVATCSCSEFANGHETCSNVISPPVAGSRSFDGLKFGNWGLMHSNVDMRVQKNVLIVKEAVPSMLQALEVQGYM